MQFDVLRDINTYLNGADLSLSPSDISSKTNQIIRDLTGLDNFYLQVKQESTDMALQGYPLLKELAKQGDDPFEQALKIAAAGNVIDVVHMDNYDLWDEVEHTVAKPLLGNAVDELRTAIEKATFLLYLADNAGETVFDRVLIESLDLPVIYAVKGGPILNDATRDDALAAGIDQVAQIIETGSNGPGTLLQECNYEFLEVFSQASVVLAKGQANFETLHTAGKHIFNLLRIKCPLIGRETGFSTGELVLLN